MRATSKYHSIKSTVDGITFDSRREANRWCELKLLQRAGAICDLQRQVRFVLAPPVRVGASSRMKPALRFLADFTYRDVQLDETVVEDVKSEPTATKEAFRIKLHLMKSVHGIDVQIVT